MCSQMPGMTSTRGINKLTLEKSILTVDISSTKRKLSVKSDMHTITVKTTVTLNAESRIMITKGNI